MCTEKRVSINVVRQTFSFRVTAPTYVRLRSFRFLPVATLKSPGVSAPIENEEALHKRMFDACQTIRNRPETFERVRQSVIRSDHAGIGSG